jgi:2,3-dihydroxyphenylpropionate 1,2-dioxygenase
MAEVVCAISMSHAPLALGEPDAPNPDVRRRLSGAVSTLASRLDVAKPEVIVALLDDHFENHFRNLMPIFSMGVAPAHSGPGDHLLNFLRFDRKVDIPGEPAMAEALLRRLVESGFDVARMGQVEYGNNLMVPIKLIRPQFDIPIIPVYINVFSPPLAPVRRVYAFGQALRDAVEAIPGNKRVAFLATGGLSHWPPVWMEKSDTGNDAFLQRMKRFQTEGRSVLKEDPHLWDDLGKYEIEMAQKSTRPLVNEAWDRDFLTALGRGDVDYMLKLSHEEIEEKAGHGGEEVLLWIAAMGAMRGAPAKVLEYEPVIEWICGMGYALYEVNEATRRKAA